MSQKTAISDETMNILPQNSSGHNISPPPSGVQRRELYTPLQESLGFVKCGVVRDKSIEGKIQGPEKEAIRTWRADFKKQVYQEKS